MKSGQTSKQKFAQERKETFRDQIAAQGHQSYAFELIMKIQDLSIELEVNEVTRMKIALDGHFKFLNKYLPDIKAHEVTVDSSGQQSADDHRQAIAEIVDIGTGKRKMAS